MKKNNIFWIGYSDLMTSLFFVMLVLFVVTVGFLRYKIKTTEEELQKIEELQTAIKRLPQEYFEYQPSYKRFKLKEHVQFKKESSLIEPSYDEYLTKVGKSIESLIDSLRQTEELNKLDIKYVVIIEGMASMDDYQRNYELSYERALSLYRFWKSRNIVFDPHVCEVQISGSGTEGIGRYTGDEEYLNQQFLIQIIPKLGKIELVGNNKRQTEIITEKVTAKEEKKDEIIVKEDSPKEMIVEQNSLSDWRKDYDSIGKFNQDNLAIVSKNLKFGLVTKKGEEVIPVVYNYIGQSGDEDFYIVQKDEKIGVMDNFGRMITPLKYDGIGKWSEGLVVVISNEKCGYIDIDGEEVISLSYDRCEDFNSGRAKVLYMGREIYINTEGNLIGVVE
ncbi:WG repeat-containing protein [Pareuzebyella sediminis]|uniref:WG repeat-containing protein n=1 Tax=Pareuzebyella sediminis TaxID=2607998 RepID=UPI0011EE578E|nr:WG repeat-containing protein [Pareuzebyella sediminis]